MTAITATRVAQEIRLDARHPAPEWAKATPVTFCADWQGLNPDPERQTEVRALWTPTHLYLRFVCRYRELFVFDDSGANGRRDQLWDRDVAEAFLQPDPSHPQHYKEFEVSPNGMWIDLDIGPRNISREEPPRDLKSGLTRSVWLDQERPHMGGRSGDSHACPYPELRPDGRLAGELLSRGRNARTPLLFGVAAHQNASAQLPCAGSIWIFAV